MALSAASPFYRGYVSDIDCRWGVISASVDDRTREERGLEVRNDFFFFNPNRSFASHRGPVYIVTPWHFEVSLDVYPLGVHIREENTGSEPAVF